MIASERRDELPADQVTTQDEKKIDTDPAETIHPARQFESEEGGVINDHHDDGEGAEKIETGLALAIGKARIDYRVRHESTKEKVEIRK